MVSASAAPRAALSSASRPIGQVGVVLGRVRKVARFDLVHFGVLLQFGQRLVVDREITVILGFLDRRVEIVQLAFRLLLAFRLRNDHFAFVLLIDIRRIGRLLFARFGVGRRFVGLLLLLLLVVGRERILGDHAHEIRNVFALRVRRLAVVRILFFVLQLFVLLVIVGRAYCRVDQIVVLLKLIADFLAGRSLPWQRARTALLIVLLTTEATI